VTVKIAPPLITVWILIPPMECVLFMLSVPPCSLESLVHVMRVTTEMVISVHPIVSTYMEITIVSMLLRNTELVTKMLSVPLLIPVFPVFARTDTKEMV